ncbi:MAG: helix-turn-helix transcriptional regulator [Pseudobdellovibrio sp.]
MKITGELLKSERVNKNLSVQDVALSLKLSSKIINAIEAGNLDSLPAKTFVRGFVKSYAQLLKLDADVVLRQFQEEMGSTNPLPKVPPPMPVPMNENNIKAPRPALKHTSQNYANKNPSVPNANLNSENPRKIILMISIAVALVVVLVLTNKIIDSFKANPVAVTTETTQTLAQSPEEVPPVVAASADISVAVISQDIAIAKSTDSTAPEPIAVKTENTVDEAFAKSSGKAVEVLIEGRKETEVFYAKGDSTKFTSLKISANQVHILRSKVGLYLKASDVSAIKISVNGVEYGLPSSNNKAVKLAF